MNKTSENYPRICRGIGCPIFNIETLGLIVVGNFYLWTNSEQRLSILFCDANPPRTPKALGLVTVPNALIAKSAGTQPTPDSRSINCW